MGPGFIRGDAYVCGASLADESGRKIYLPIAHVEDNYDRDQVIRYLQHQLGGEQVKCGANIGYDLEGLSTLGVTVHGKLGDVQIAEPLLDEEKLTGYSLNVLAKEYLGKEKDESMLREAANAYGCDPKKDMARLPGRFVAQYADTDALLPVEIYQLQLKKLEEEGLMPIYEIEQELQRVLIRMRRRGVAVNVKKAEELSAQLLIEEDELQAQMNHESGMRIKPSSSQSVGAALHNKGVYVPVTTKGNYSVTNDWLASQKEPLCKLISKWRKSTKMRRDFIHGMIVEQSTNGRVHSNWHQLRTPKDQDSDSGDSGGTRSGRIAASKVNLTQIPSRDPKWGPMIRDLFLPDHGGRWGKFDYSQQEPRIQLHYAYLRGFQGAAEARQRYIDDPSTDYHQLVADLIKDRTGQDLGRRAAKDINLGSAYGMGVYKLSRKLGVDEETAKGILKTYHEGVPYTKKLEAECMNVVNQRGYIKTILGRKRRFDRWELDRYGTGEMPEAYTLEEAKRRWPNQVLRRAFTHKSLNALIQGSAGDQMKYTIVLLGREGIDPQIQVYDELDGTFDSDGQMKRVREIMEHSIESTVPFLVEPEVGDSWGSLTDWVEGSGQFD